MTKPTFPSPSAGGDYVLVPREPTKEMIQAGCNSRVDGWEDSYYDDLERQDIVEWVKADYKAMLTAAPAPVPVIELDQKENSK